MATSEKLNPFAALDGRKDSVNDGGLITVKSLSDADEALNFLENHPRAAEIAEEGAAILADPVRYKKLVRKIDLTIAPLLAAVYFLQFLDKTTLSYTAVMGIRTDTHLVGQDYSNLSMLFYVGIATFLYLFSTHLSISAVNCIIIIQLAFL
jgi:ACS family allantoate permease-like MFS transporter